MAPRQPNNHMEDQADNMITLVQRINDLSANSNSNMNQNSKSSTVTYDSNSKKTSDFQLMHTGDVVDLINPPSFQKLNDKCIYRFPSQYLTHISGKYFQISHGTICLQYFQNVKQLPFKSGDKIIVVARKLGQQMCGNIQKATAQTILNFKQIIQLRRKSKIQLKPLWEEKHSKMMQQKRKILISLQGDEEYLLQQIRQTAERLQRIPKKKSSINTNRFNSVVSYRYRK